MRVGVVVNARAQALRQSPHLAEGIRLAAGGDAEVWITQELSELDQAIDALLASRVERIVFCGGDGTLMAGASAVVRAAGSGPLPEFCAAPGGTVATVAKNWGQRAGLLDTVRAAVADAPPRARLMSPTLRVQADDVERIGFIFGSGLVARFFERYYAAGGEGLTTAGRIFVRVFVGSFVEDRFSRSVLEPLACRLIVDGEPLPDAAFSLIVSAVVRNLGLGMRVTHRAAEDPARPHLVATSLSTRQLGPQAPRVLMGKPLRGEGCFDDLVTGFELCFDDHPGPWVLDGDVFFSERVSVSAGPRLRVVAY
jgi:diacylglycerol kinase family enzyme